MRIRITKRYERSIAQKHNIRTRAERTLLEDLSRIPSIQTKLVRFLPLLISILIKSTVGHIRTLEESGTTNDLPRAGKIMAFKETMAEALGGGALNCGHLA